MLKHTCRHARRRVCTYASFLTDSLRVLSMIAERLPLGLPWGVPERLTYRFPLDSCFNSYFFEHFLGVSRGEYKKYQISGYIPKEKP